MTEYRTDSAFAQEMDAQDPLAKYRDEFYIAEAHGKESIYFCGNSLGLQPKRTEAAIQQELKDQWLNFQAAGKISFHP